MGAHKKFDGFRRIPKGFLQFFYIPKHSHLETSFLSQPPRYETIIALNQSPYNLTYLIVQAGVDANTKTTFVSRKLTIVDDDYLTQAKTLTNVKPEDRKEAMKSMFSHLANLPESKQTEMSTEAHYGSLKLTDLGAFFLRFPCYNESLHVVHGVTNSSLKAFLLIEEWLATGKPQKLPSNTNNMRLFIVAQLWDQWERLNLTWEERLKWINFNCEYGALKELKFSSVNSFQHWCRDNFSAYT